MAYEGQKPASYAFGGPVLTNATSYFKGSNPMDPTFRAPVAPKTPAFAPLGRSSVSSSNDTSAGNSNSFDIGSSFKTPASAVPDSASYTSPTSFRTPASAVPDSSISPKGDDDIEFPAEGKDNG